MSVVLHVGMPNAGSSAIQHRLWRHRTDLGERGVFYFAQPEAPRLVSSGNGKDLAAYLDPRRRLPDFSEATFERKFHKRFVSETHAISLISAEQLAGAQPDMLERFKGQLLQGREIKVVAFVRDIYSHARSCWMQQIKRKAYSGSFEHYALGSYSEFQGGAIRRFARAFGWNAISLIHLDSLKEDIFGAFLGTLGVRGGFGPTPPVNRGLSDVEVGVLRLCNRIHRDPDLATRISDHVLAKRPFRPRTQLWSGRVADRFEELYAKRVANVNARVFGEAMVWSVAPRARSPIGTPPQSLLEVWGDVAEALLVEFRRKRLPPAAEDGLQAVQSRGLEG